MKIYIFFIVSLLIYDVFVQDEYYIIIKNKNMVSDDTKKEAKKKQSVKEDKNKLIEVKDTSDCKYYDIKEAYICKTCLKFLTEEQKTEHPSEHELEKTKIGVRLKCQSCNKLFLGDITTYCPKCKGKLKLEIIEIIEKENPDEKYFVNKKINVKICQNEKTDKKDILEKLPPTANTKLGK